MNLPVLRIIVLCAALCPLRLVASADESTRVFSLPAGDAAETLKLFAAQAQREIMFPAEPVAGVRTNPLEGRHSARAALQILIAGTGLTAVEDARTGALMVTRPSAPQTRAAPPAAATTSPPEKNPSAMKRKNPLALIGGWLALVLAPAPAAPAADDGTLAVGAIEGRVYNAVNGAYLNNARVSLEGTDREIQTNSFGEFRFDRVPVGPARVRVIVSGFPPQTAATTVAAAAPAVVNVGLSLAEKEKPGADKVVVLDSFVVESQREMSGSAIAINERRTAANLKNVVAADEFGDSPEGNVAEFLKQMSGISIGYNSFDARTVEVRGLPSFGTAVSFDGAPIASGTNAPGRETEFNQASLTNTARIEVIKSPLPDTRADTIGGSVNIVSKSAFELSRPLFNYRANLSANLSQWDGGDYFSFGRLPFARGATHLVLPGFDASYIRPINKNLGFSISASASNQFTPEPMITSSWRPTHAASTLATADRPFLAAVGLQDGPKIIYRRAFAGTLDWRVGPRDVINVGVQLNWWRAIVDQDLQSFSIGSVVPAYSPTFAQSAPGAGSITRTLTTYDKVAPSYTTLLRYRHSGPVWKLDGGASFSESWSRVEAERDGVVKTLGLTLPNATVRYDGIQDSIPRAITTETAAGGPLDWRTLANYRLASVSFGNPQEARNGTAGARVSATRDFGRRIPFQVKVGADVRRESRDYRTPTASYTFVGPDRVANSADDSAARYGLVADSWSRVSLPFGLGRTERPASDKMFALFKEHPEYFVYGETAALQSAANNSQKLSEVVAAAYLRVDTSLLQNRLKLVGGVRYEATFDEGFGILNDLSNTYLKDAAGRIVRDGAGRPVRASTDPVALARLQYTERGSHAKRDYDDYYPSLNASFALSEKLMLRAAYARTITRPQLSNIIPSITATDPTATNTVPTITVTNTGLRPWYSDSFDVGLEYYFDKPGVVSVGAFRKDITDFFGSVRSPVTPAQLAEWGFDESFSNYEVVSRENIGSARVSGLEFEFRQTLTWVPARFGHVLVYLNSTSIHVEGASAGSISGFLPFSMNYGVTYSNPRLTARINCNQRGRTRSGQITGNNVSDGTFNYTSPKLNVDFNAEYRLLRRVSVFVNVRNITNVPWRLEAYGPATPAYARGTRWIEYGPNALFGIKGAF